MICSVVQAMAEGWGREGFPAGNVPQAPPPL